ncbi:uncharacterized protein LOC132740749 isoform X2 [Ruditapes philippinarum]|uniref:uncharacterized protein LOC132740749 isoform X2 n=1 Tax=Ruditapes philippinarum TaxID=129788 RepID=UPI00295AAF03|nr:uncharacterized protein LOC132740749 isoform X2 [Ruditapes philippinarum]XP_060584702.1 uncharacterized protein LOC132740749 isoform X2 [Ruditapes philippinarum]
MTSPNKYRLIQVLAFCIFVINVDSTCRQRCKLSLEQQGYKTCVKAGTKCKKGPSGIERCYEKEPVVVKSATFKSSSVEGEAYEPSNIFDGDMNTFWASEFGEEKPFIEITFAEEYVICSYIIKGLNIDMVFSNAGRLTHFEMSVDDIMLPESSYTYNSEANIVTVTGPEKSVKKIKLMRFKPPNLAGEWGLAVVELELYV